MEETINFKADGMMCQSCEKIIQKQALTIDGVKACEIDYATQQGKVVFDSEKTDINKILSKIEEKGYKCSVIQKSEGSSDEWVGWVIAIMGFALIGYFLLRFVDTIHLPQLTPTMSYGLLFTVGILTGFHCVAMCGGFVVSYTAKDAKEGRLSYKSHLFYAFGKTLSYTIIGAVFGLIGSIIAFTPLMSGAAGIVAGLFLIIFGLNMLDLFPSLRKLRLRMPKSLSRFTGDAHQKHSKSPLIIGLLNGLMIACGPLQAIYIMAAGTGSMIEGAKLLFIFGLGTLPVMLGFGHLTSYISGKATQKILKASGAIVIILGMIMLNTGLTLTGSGYDARTLITRVTSANSGTYTAQSNNVAVQKEGYQEIRMDVENNGWAPDKFILKKGVPVHWVINGKEVLSCNGGIQVPKYNLKFQIQQGEQTIKFTPTESGVIPWSCWMGMIKGTFIVKDDINFNNPQEVEKELDVVPTPEGGSCGGSSGGGCGCGCGSGGCSGSKS